MLGFRWGDIPSPSKSINCPIVLNLWKGGDRRDYWSSSLEDGRFRVGKAAPGRSVEGAVSSIENNTRK